jgi:hypothetical protein
MGKPPGGHCIELSRWAEPLDLAELQSTVRGLYRRSPAQLLARLQFRQVHLGTRSLPEPLSVARREILEHTAEQLGVHAMPPAMGALVSIYLDELRAYAEVAPYLPPLDFPTVMHTVACGRGLPGPVGAALLCYYMGLHMLDDVHDDELPAGIDEDEASLVAMTLVATLPTLILMEGSGWAAPRQLRQRLAVELHCHAHATMTGQFLDISSSSAFDLAHAYDVITQRNGAIGRVFGRLAAIAAACAEPDVDALGRAVAFMSMASQVLDDIENLWNRPVSSDAVNRAKTLPLCFVLDAQADLREPILALCDDPQPASHRRLRELISSCGGLHFGLAGMSLFRAHARWSLRSFGGRTELHDLEEYLLDATAPAASPLDELLVDGSSAPAPIPGRLEWASACAPEDGGGSEASALLEATLQLVHRSQVP